MAPEDILNQALVEIGYQRPIGDIYEGSAAAILGLEIYAQTRDEVLRHDDWPFARRTNVLTLVKTAFVPPVQAWDETQPPPPWRFSYQYPSDAIFVRYLRLSPFGYAGGEAGPGTFEPLPVRFAIASDPPGPGQPPAKVILSDLENALAVYTSRVTNPDQWEALFQVSLVKALAAKLAIRLGNIPQGAAEITKEKGAAAEAAREGAGLRNG